MKGKNGKYRCKDGKRRCKDGKRQCKDERSSLDIINALPQPILETILGFLPTQEAARTSILSREWRYTWTKISKLEFDLFDPSDVSSEEKQVKGKNIEKASKPFRDILQILLSHQGPIHEFTLVNDLNHDYFGLDQIILHLSKHHRVKKLTLHGFEDYTWYELPKSVFTLHHLTDLNLYFFDIDYEQTLNEFGSLRSLTIDDVDIPSKSLLHLLSNCPSLKSLTMHVFGFHPGDRDCNIIQLFECLPMIEYLSMSGCDLKFQWFVIELVPQEFAALFNLKYFHFDRVCFNEGYGLAFLLVLIKCSPNLRKIKLLIDCVRGCDEEYFIVWEKYSDVWLEHLYELEIDFFRNKEPEMEFVKFILARSPKLKKVNIHSCVDKDQESKMLKTLLEAPRASPVTITVK